MRRNLGKVGLRAADKTPDAELRRLAVRLVLFASAGLASAVKRGVVGHSKPHGKRPRQA